MPPTPTCPRVWRATWVGGSHRHGAGLDRLSGRPLAPSDGFRLGCPAFLRFGAGRIAPAFAEPGLQRVTPTSSPGGLPPGLLPIGFPSGGSEAFVLHSCRSDIWVRAEALAVPILRRTSEGCPSSWLPFRSPSPRLAPSLQRPRPAPSKSCPSSRACRSGTLLRLSPSLRSPAVRSRDRSHSRPVRLDGWKACADRPLRLSQRLGLAASGVAGHLLSLAPHR